MTVKKKLNSNFVPAVRQNTVEEYEFDCSRCGKKVNLMSNIPAVKTATRPTSAGRNFFALSFLVNGQHFKDYHKILGTLDLDHVSFTQWIHIVEWIVPFVKRIADWRVQKARTEAVRRGGLYLPRCEDWQNYIAYFEYECKLLTMLRHQAAENSVITSGAAKKVLFSSGDCNCNYWILKHFERTSYFLGIQAWVLRQNGKQKKICAKERSKKHIFLSHFFIFHHKLKRMLKFLRNGF